MTTRLSRLCQTFVLATALACIPQTYAASPITFYEYDAQGNLRKVREVMNQSTGAERVTDNSYDALGRLRTTTYPQAQTGLPPTSVTYGYNAQDQITSVRDPKLNSTTYSVDGLGNPTQELSPDRGTTTRTYDRAGNLKTRTDARGKTVSYRYDALNRLFEMQYQDGTVTRYTKYFYDEGTNGLGRLTRITFHGGTTTYTYDPHGHVTSKTNTQGSKSFSVLYNWNPDTGQLDSLTYPSGKTLNFSYDAAGRIQSMSVNGTPIAQNIQYQPFGPPASWTWGNGQQNTRSFDTDGRMTGFLAGPGDPRVITYDDAGRITAINHPTKPNRNQSLGYDNLDRLTGWAKHTSNRKYTYDANGNREDLTVSDGTVYDYINALDSNRIQSTAGPAPARSFSYDAAGNITNDTQVAYVYNDLGRLVQATKGATVAKYTYDGLGQRIKKSGAGIYYYSYDESGHLLGTYDSEGNVVQEYVYLGDIPIAILSQAGGNALLHYVYTDQIMRPWTVTNVLNEAVWQWDTQPFGESFPNQNPESLGTFIFNLRFPGQHYDHETGLHYNYFRDYDPKTGRYMQSDPIGLAGGLNTFAYVGGNPVSRIDLQGLQGVATIPEAGIVLTLGCMLTPGCIEALSATVNAAALAVCEADCNADKAANDALCFVAKARGGKIAQKLCLDESDRIWIECLEECKEKCKEPM